MPKEDKLADIKYAYDSWVKRNAAEFKKERKKKFESESGVGVKRVYTPLDLHERGFDYLKDLALPGDWPYTRGINPTMYRSELWRGAQYSGYPTPKESNKLWKAQVGAGVDTVSIAFDLPTQHGLDPDHPEAQGEVGKVGVSMPSLRDWEVAFEGIDLNRLSIYMVHNALAAVGVASHCALASQRGIHQKELRGSCQNDIIKEYIARGGYVFPPEPSMRLATDVLCYCARFIPNYDPISVSAIHLFLRGATPIHHTAFCLANAITYIQRCVDRGVDVDLVGPHIWFLCNHEHIDFFHEIAKIRAMRKIYARIMKERFGAKKRESMVARMYTFTSGTSMYKEQYLNNIARSAIGGLAGVLAGVQMLDLRPYDEVFGIPTPEAIMTAIRTHQVISQETGVTDTIDPLGGSYFVESLTSDYEEAILKEIEKIDKMGGSIKAMEQGYMQTTMARDAYQSFKEFEKGTRLRVGVNCFKSQSGVEERPIKVFRANPEAERIQVAAVRKLRKSRDNRRVKRALEEVKCTASLPESEANNLLPSLIEAVKAYATVGEICSVLKEIWGEHRESTTF